MATMTTSLLFVVACALLLHLSCAQSPEVPTPTPMATMATAPTSAPPRMSRNPCHAGRNARLLGAFDCEGIVLPKRMCARCNIGDYSLTTGIFNDCTNMYRTMEPSCVNELQEYVRLNPCDDVRARQVANMDNPRNAEALDYFIYSVCEECCDCIPRGSREDQFLERRDQGVNALTSVFRGNCPAHAHFDICRIWPEIRYITVEGGPTFPQYPKICPIISDWFFSPASEDWPNNDNTEIARPIQRFLRQYNRFTRCRRRSTWESCTLLETAQRRI